MPDACHTVPFSSAQSCAGIRRVVVDSTGAQCSDQNEDTRALGGRSLRVQDAPSNDAVGSRVLPGAAGHALPIGSDASLAALSSQNLFHCISEVSQSEYKVRASVSIVLPLLAVAGAGSPGSEGNTVAEDTFREGDRAQLTYPGAIGTAGGSHHMDV